ncbi:unnamed protein product [Lampetra planeri]
MHSAAHAACTTVSSQRSDDNVKLFGDKGAVRCERWHRDSCRAAEVRATEKTPDRLSLLLLLPPLLLLLLPPPAALCAQPDRAARVSRGKEPHTPCLEEGVEPEGKREWPEHERAGPQDA